MVFNITEKRDTTKNRIKKGISRLDSFENAKYLQALSTQVRYMVFLSLAQQKDHVFQMNIQNINFWYNRAPDYKEVAERTEDMHVMIYFWHCIKKKGKEYKVF